MCSVSMACFTIQEEGVSSSLLVWSEQLRLNPVMGTAVLTGPWICRENVLFKVVVTLGVITW